MLFLSLQWDSDEVPLFLVSLACGIPLTSTGWMRGRRHEWGPYVDRLHVHRVYRSRGARKQQCVIE